MQTLVLASGNAGKLREFSALFAETFAPCPFVLRLQSEFDLESAEEPHATFIENALAKARHAAHHTGLPALADDSGICVNALQGAPGVHSARYANAEDKTSSDANNNQKLIHELASHTDRSAYYYCVLVLLRTANDPQPLIAQGIWQGEIIDAATGENGFGYDPHFWLPSLNKTAAQLSLAEKNRISHRGLALNALTEQMRALEFL